MCRSAKVKTVLAGGGMDDASLNESAIKRVMKKQGYSIQNLRHLLSVVSLLRWPTENSLGNLLPFGRHSGIFPPFCLNLAVRSATLCSCSKRSLNSVSFWKKASIFPTNSLSINAAGVGRISCSITVSELPDHNPVKLKLTYEYRFNGSMSSSERSLLSLGFSGGIGISGNRRLEVNRHRTFKRLTIQRSWDWRVSLWRTTVKLL